MRVPVITISRLVVACLALLPLPGRAIDLGGIVRNAFERAVSQKAHQVVNDAFRSISTVSSGQVARDTERPADTAGKVILYRNATCGYCKKAASYMHSRDIPFVERDVNASATFRDEYRAYGGKGGVPLLVIGSETLHGFSEAAFDERYARMTQSAGKTNAVP